ncbi:hypothetical protein [Niastella populi]|nr:hypothetical protein [Niastella populi]
MESKKVNSREFIPTSPVASMFNIFGTIPVSHYTGTPDVSIPLGGISYKDLGLDLTLRYHHAIGAKPDAIPGYFGNGWLLTTGGVITRLSKGVRTAEISGENDVPVPASRFDKNVRILKSYPNDIYGSSFQSIRYVASLQYTYYPYVESKEEETFAENGESIVTITDNAYDDEYKVLKQSTVKGSNNISHTTLLQYPFDEVRNGNTVPYRWRSIYYE